MEKIIIDQNSKQSDLDIKVLQTSFNFNDLTELKDLLNKHKNAIFLFLDTETTGLGGHKKQQITQLASIPCSYEKINGVARFRECYEDFNIMASLNDDQKEIIKDKSSQTYFVLNELNHYFENIKDIELIDEQTVLKMFFDYINDMKEFFGEEEIILVAQNANFDMDMIYGRSEQEYTVYPSLCTKIVILKTFIPQIKKLSDNGNKKAIDICKQITKVNKKNKEYLSSSMGVIAPALGVDLENYHDALGDCKTTIEMFNKILKLS